jgi:hypothetical protein
MWRLGRGWLAAVAWLSPTGIAERTRTRAGAKSTISLLYSLDEPSRRSNNRQNQCGNKSAASIMQSWRDLRLYRIHGLIAD